MLSLFGRELAIRVENLGASLDRAPAAAPGASEYSRSYVRSSASTAFSLAAHLVLTVLVVAVAKPAAPATPHPPKDVARLVHLVYVPPSMALTLPRRLPPGVVRKVALPTLRETTPAAWTPVREVATLAVEPTKLAEPAPVDVTPPAPAPTLTPTIGVFPESKAAAPRTPQMNQRVATAGFDPRVQARAERQLGQAAVGAFDVAPDARPRRQVSSNDVSDAGFSRTSAPARDSQPTGAVRDSGFAAASPGEPVASTAPTEIKSAGFTDARNVEAAKRAEITAVRPSLLPVEVLSKPTPVYSEEGRRLKVEGEVVLEVEFAAAGSLRVLRVVRGLGHGLDEAAMRAAEQIRFKPATAAGQAVDYRTTVQIVFRLS